MHFTIEYNLRGYFVKNWQLIALAPSILSLGMLKCYQATRYLMYSWCIFSPSVCTTTIWIGRVPKTTSEYEIREMMEEFGPVVSVEVSTSDLQVVLLVL